MPPSDFAVRLLAHRYVQAITDGEKATAPIDKVVCATRAWVCADVLAQLDDWSWGVLRDEQKASARRYRGQINQIAEEPAPRPVPPLPPLPPGLVRSRTWPFTSAYFEKAPSNKEHPC